MDEMSIFLAKFWGWYFIIFFLILSFNTKRILQEIKDLEDQKFVIVFSFLAIVIGLLNILFHNIWEDDWRLIITIIDWIVLFIGLLCLFFQNERFYGSIISTLNLFR
jgi:uncharacterized membrane protein